MPNTVSIRVRVQDATRSGIDAVNGSLGSLTRSAAEADRSMKDLTSAALSLAPALIPVAAAAAPLAASLAGAGAGMAAFGAAVGGQLVALKNVSDAQKKFNDAIQAHGAGSKQAAEAEGAWLSTLGSLPPATREAAAAMGALKDAYMDWSDAAADDTMPVLTHGMQALEAVFPKFTPMVEDSAHELDRLVTIAAGGIESSSFQQFADTMDDFAEQSLQKVTTGLVHLVRITNGQEIGGNFREFMDYARSVGPQVGQTLKDIGQAATNLLTAAADTGVSMLKLVDAFARMVAALPTSLITNMLQFYAAVKLTKLAIAGFGAAAKGMTLVTAELIAMRSAAGGASTRLGGLRAAVAALSTKAKVALAATGIGLLVVALSSLSKIGKEAPPDVNKLTTSLKELGRTGKTTGEAARAFGEDLGGLADSLRTLARPSNLDSVQQFLTSLIGMDSTPVANAKEDLNAVDDALTNLVKGGKADLASSAFDRIAKAMRGQGLTTEELRGKLGDYQSALADLALEQDLSADGMGLFGDKATEVQAKLDAQKKSTDGLRLSIQALNDIQRAGLGGMIGFEQAIDDATQSARDNAGALHMVHGQLNLNGEKARDAAKALQDLATKTDSAAAAAHDADGNWNRAAQIYERGRTKLVHLADQMGLTKTQAQRLADQILKTPNKTAYLRGNLDDLKRKLAEAKKRLRNAPDSQTAHIKGEIGDLKRAIRAAKRDLRNIPDEHVNVYMQRRFYGPSHPGVRASGGVIGGHAAGGGPRSSLTLVGEQGPELVKLPFGATVHSNPDSRRIMSQAGGGGGGERPIV
ncbi:MAG TPA: hypothetical protein VFH77_16185, partial [Streptomyces sp.]|nr:hypothetical protein [Streptomyces sp.]